MKVTIVDINEAPDLEEIRSVRAIVGRDYALTIAAATDEDIGQVHSYSALLTSGAALPGWLVFTEAERSFKIAGNAGAVVGIYQISVAVEDSGEPVLGAHQEFALTVVDGGQIEAGSLPAFSRARPVHDLSVRLSAQPDQEVTVALEVSDAATVSPAELVFDGDDWSSWQVAQVSLSAATTVRKEDLDFAVTVAVHEAATADELYVNASPVQVAGKYEGPGNANPRISTTEVRVNENAGGQESNAGTRIGSPVSATDADNDDASLTYAIDPASDLFGIGESDGQITLSVATNFNYEKGEKEYTLTVQVKDPDGGSSTGEVKVTIVDINEAPDLEEIRSVRAIVGRDYALTIVAAKDEDIGQVHSYSALLTSGAALPGWLVFTEAERSFKIAANAGAVVGIYQISVAVEDSGEPVLGAHQEFALTVVDGGQIEAGSLPALQPRRRLRPRSERAAECAALSQEGYGCPGGIGSGDGFGRMSWCSTGTTGAAGRLRR